MRILHNLNLKNKIFLSILAVIILLSVGIALATRFVLVSSLTSELTLRGIAIAQSVADQGKSYVLTKDRADLVSLVFDTTQLQERKVLVSYIFILDNDNNVLAHSFIEGFPKQLIHANLLDPGRPYDIKLLSLGPKQIYDVVVPIKEGIYKIGAVHVGIDKQHIENLIARLRLTYLGVIAAILILFFLVSHWLSRYITRPISKLTKISDEISKGNFDIKPEVGSETMCWDMRNCKKGDCPAHQKTDIPCWYVDETQYSDEYSGRFPEKLEQCQDCVVYRRGTKDEVRQLADAFMNMTYRLNLSQARLKESEEKYKSLFDSGPDPIFVCDMNTYTILDANPSAESTYGYSSEELIGKSFLQIQSAGFRDGETPSFEEDPANRTCIIGAKVKHRKKDGKAFYVNVHVCPTKYRGIDALIIGTTDITEMMEKDTQLLQASKMTSLGEMSAGIAHELNQPLNVIKMGSEYLQLMIEKRELFSEENLNKVSREISGQVDRAAEIISHLRDFSRKTEFSKRKIDLNNPIKAALSLMGRQLSLQNIQLALDLDPAIPPILAHNNRLEQVIFNLVSNARDAVNQRGEGDANGRREIRIRSFREGDRVAVAISDTGVGIPQETLNRIFEPFYTTKDAGKGLGLGLYVTYGIIKDYGGEIRVESEVDKGTTFIVTFPMYAPPAVSLQ